MLLPQPQQAYEEGYEAYYNDGDCPYNSETQPILWNIWCDGYNDARCAEECK